MTEKPGRIEDSLCAAAQPRKLDASSSVGAALAGRQRVDLVRAVGSHQLVLAQLDLDRAGAAGSGSPARVPTRASAGSRRARGSRVDTSESRILDVAEQPRARRAGHHARGLAVLPAAAPRRRCGRRTACTWSSPGAARRARARRTGRPRRSTCSRCTCRSRPARCRPPCACSSRRSGRPARRAAPRSAGSDFGKCTVCVSGNSPTS